MKYNQKRVTNWRTYIFLVQRAFRTEYQKDDTLSHSVVKNIFSNFEKHGSVAYAYPKQKKSGQKREMTKNQLENLVSEYLVNLVSIVNQTSVQYFSWWHLKPCKLHLKHNLEDKDYEKRLNFAHWFLKQLKSAHEYKTFTNVKPIFI